MRFLLCPKPPTASFEVSAVCLNKYLVHRGGLLILRNISLIHPLTHFFIHSLTVTDVDMSEVKLVHL